MSNIQYSILSILIVFNILFNYNSALLLIINIITIIYLSLRLKKYNKSSKFIIIILYITIMYLLFVGLFIYEENKIYYAFQYLRILSFFIVFTLCDDRLIENIGSIMKIIVTINSILVLLYFMNVQIIRHFITQFQISYLGSPRTVFGYRVGGLFSFLDAGMISMVGIIIILNSKNKKLLNIITIIMAMFFEARTPILLLGIYYIITGIKDIISYKIFKNILIVMIVLYTSMSFIKVVSPNTYSWIGQMYNFESMESVQSLKTTVNNVKEDLYSGNGIDIVLGTGRVAWQGTKPIETDNGYFRSLIGIGLIATILSMSFNVINILYIKNKYSRVAILLIFIIFNYKGTMLIGYPVPIVYLFLVEYLKRSR